MAAGSDAEAMLVKAGGPPAEYIDAADKRRRMDQRHLDMEMHEVASSS